MNWDLPTNSPAKRIQLGAGIAISVLALLLPFAVVWLSARQIVSSDFERSVRVWCGVGAVVGPLCAWNAFRKQKAWSFLLAVLVPLLLLSTVWATSFYSDRMFAYWMVYSRSPAEWQQMGNAIYGLTKETAAHKTSRIDPEHLPESVRHLGRADRCWGADCRVDAESDQVFVQVFYGNRNRHWGLRIASAEYLRSSAFLEGSPKCISIATNAQFYIGSGQ